MNRLLSWLLGLGVGSAVAVLLVGFFVPYTARGMRQRLGEGYYQARMEAYQASELRRAELAAQLTDLRGDSQVRPLPPTTRR
jgi:hypothetical protein